MNGALAEGALPGLLRELYVGRKTGLLHVTQGGARRSIRFRGGHIIHAVSSVAAERMGEMLMREGHLSHTDLDRATALMNEEKRRLGQVLIDLGILEAGTLEEAVTRHAGEILHRVFSGGAGTYEFEAQAEGDLPPDADVTLKLSTGELILDAVRMVKDPDAVRRGIGDPERVLVLSNDPLLRFQKVRLTPADGYILSRVDGHLNAREIVPMIPMVPEEVERSLFGLLSIGIIESGEPRPKRAPVSPATPAAAAPTPPAAVASAPARPNGPAAEAKPPAPPQTAQPPEEEKGSVEARRQEILEAHAGLKTRNHFEVLGIPKASSEAQVKEAYFKLARRFHPDAHHDKSMADLRDKLEAVFIRLGQAYEVLRNPKSRTAYEEDLASRMPRAAKAAAPAPEPVKPPPPDPAAEAKAAQLSLRQAEKLFEAEKYFDAIQMVEPALDRLESKSKARARLLLGRAYAKNPNWIHQAEEHLKAAVESDPKSVDALLALAGIYRDHGLKSRAVAMYRKVMDLKPDHEDAIRALAALNPEDAPPPEEKGGLLKKLFGRG